MKEYVSVHLCKMSSNARLTTPVCRWGCREYEVHGWCLCSPFRGRQTKYKEEDTLVPSYPIAKTYPKYRVVLDMDSFPIGWIQPIRENFDIVMGIISPYNYVRYKLGLFKPVELHLNTLEEQGKLLVIDSSIYLPGFGCEDVIGIHLANNHYQCAFMSRDTLTNKKGEIHAMLPHIQIYHNGADFIVIRRGKDISDKTCDPDSTIGCVHNQCTKKIEECIPDFILSHYHFNIENDSISRKRKQIEHLQNKSKKCSIDISEDITSIEDEIKKLQSMKKLTLQEIQHELFSKPQEFDSPILYNLYGSRSGSPYPEIDVMVVVLQPVSVARGREIILYFKYYMCSKYESVKLNVNLCTVKDGIITWVYTGIPGECNNSVYHTYSLHQQKFKKICNHVVNVQLEEKYEHLKRILLDAYKDIGYKSTFKSPQIKSPEEQQKFLSRLDHNEYIGKMNMDQLRHIAYQVGAYACFADGFPVYTKDDVSNKYPELHGYLIQLPMSTSYLTEFVRTTLLRSN